MSEYVVHINKYFKDYIGFGFDSDEKGAEQFAEELCQLVHRWIPWCQMACGRFAYVDCETGHREEEM